MDAAWDDERNHHIDFIHGDSVICFFYGHFEDVFFLLFDNNRWNTVVLSAFPAFCLLNIPQMN